MEISLFHLPSILSFGINSFASLSGVLFSVLFSVDRCVLVFMKVKKSVLQFEETGGGTVSKRNRGF